MTRVHSFVRMAIAFSVLLFSADFVAADTIVTGNVTDFFGNGMGDADSGDAGGLLFDEARTGGGDSNTAASINVTKNLVSSDGGPNGNWAAGLPIGTPSSVTFTGLGLVFRGGTTATNVDVTIRYLGADGTFNTADDEIVGTASDPLSYVNVSESVWNFSDPMIFAWDGGSDAFRFELTGSDALGDPADLRFKQQGVANSASGQGGLVMSVGGSVVAVPEPLSLAVISCLGLCTLSRRRKRVLR